MNPTMSAKESELWKLSLEALNSYPSNGVGLGKIHRNPDPAVRQLGKTEGSFEWAILASSSLASSNFTDEKCEMLINIIKGGRK